MSIKFFATIVISLFSVVCFSQTKKLSHSFERHFESYNYNSQISSCWGPRFFLWGCEDYTINLFSDSTFHITYSQKGNLSIDYRKTETANGRFFTKSDTVYMVQIKATINELDKSLYKSKLDEVLYSGIPLRIHYTEDSLLVYNTVCPFMIFQKVSFFDKYKNQPKPSLIYPLSPRLLNKTNSIQAIVNSQAYIYSLKHMN
ncbi:hypothetical protein [Ferruginibacter sp.]